MYALSQIFSCLLYSIFQKILLKIAKSSHFVLLQFEDDAVLIPRETAWFGYYPDGAFNPVLPPQEVTLPSFLVSQHCFPLRCLWWPFSVNFVTKIYVCRQSSIPKIGLAWRPWTRLGVSNSCPCQVVTCASPEVTWRSTSCLTWSRMRHPSRAYAGYCRFDSVQGVRLLYYMRTTCVFGKCLYHLDPVSIALWIRWNAKGRNESLVMFDRFFSLGLGLVSLSHVLRIRGNTY